MDEFKTECERTDAYLNLKIFDQFMSNFHYLGIFGNANPEYKQDWVKVVFSDAEKEKLSEKGVYDEFTETCTKITSSLEVEILTSKLGYQDHLQDYIVGAKITAVDSTWIFDPTKEGETQTFSYYASVSYR